VQGGFAQRQGWGNEAVLMERVMAGSAAGKGDGAGLFPVAAGESIPAGMAPGKQAAPRQRPGEGPGLPSPSLPASPKTRRVDVQRGRGRRGGPAEELADLFWQAAFRGRHRWLCHRIRSINPIQLPWAGLRVPSTARRLLPSPSGSPAGRLGVKSMDPCPGLGQHWHCGVCLSFPFPKMGSEH